MRSAIAGFGPQCSTTVSISTSALSSSDAQRHSGPLLSRLWCYGVFFIRFYESRRAWTEGNTSFCWAKMCAKPGTELRTDLRTGDGLHTVILQLCKSGTRTRHNELFLDHERIAGLHRYGPDLQEILQSRPITQQPRNNSWGSVLCVCACQIV